MAPPFVHKLRRSGLDSLDRARFRWDQREARAAATLLAPARTASEWLDVTPQVIPGGSSQIPQEILGFIEFARRHNPKTFVEIGTEAGGTNFLISRAIESVDRVLAVDLWVHNRARLARYTRSGVEFTAINGDSAAAATVAGVERALAGRKIDLLFIDGDHSLAGVLADLRLYRSFVVPHGLIAFHDIVPDERLRSGRPSRAYAGEVPVLWECLRTRFPHHEFVADWDQEGLGIGVIENFPEAEIVIVPSRSS